MARWRLTQPHYLNVPGTEWEYKENPRGGKKGKDLRKTFPVPLHLDPREESDWTHEPKKGEGGFIVVSWAGSSDPNDVIFIGDPTPDMEPIDDEAKAISKKFAEQWKHPIEALPGTYSQSLLDKFQSEVAEVASQTKVAASSTQNFNELMGVMAKMMEQNATLIAALAPKINMEPPTSAQTRRV